MKGISEKFKEEIKRYGRQIDTIITYKIDNIEHILDSDTLISVISTTNGDILKSVMKQLKFESSVKVPKNTVINVKFGVQIDLSLTVQDINEMKVNRLNDTLVKYLSGNLKGFEYINLGNYIVYEEPEYNADTLSYSHTCYDKMLNSMKNYEKTLINFPITIREYIDKLCTKIGLQFKNKNDIFANYNKNIKTELYDENYTYRDILDELAQVTASTICINEVTDELEVRYVNETQDVIDEDYLKDINVKFEKKYGPINSIVLSRSAESDNVFLQDEKSIKENGLCELKIIDNQIMNDNDRSDFLPDILEKLKTLQYFINDFSSPGITYYELCDKYKVKIGENLYDCILFNDEVKITQGLEETIYTEMPIVTETDYSKADKTDRKIKQTNFIVDKQNQTISALIKQQVGTDTRLVTVEQSIDGFKTTVSNIETKLENDIYTKEETNTQIKQSADNITGVVSANYVTKTSLDTVNETLTASLELKVDTKNLISEINASADRISLTAGRLVITAGNFQLDDKGNITAISGKIGGFNISSTYLANGTTSLASSNNSVYLGTNGISCGTAFKVTNTGSVTCSDINITGGQIQLYASRGNNGIFRISDKDTEGTAEGYEF